MRISDWSSDVCSSDLSSPIQFSMHAWPRIADAPSGRPSTARMWFSNCEVSAPSMLQWPELCTRGASSRSEEHTSELQSLMRNSYAVFCLKKKNENNRNSNDQLNLQPQTKSNPSSGTTEEEAGLAHTRSASHNQKT